MLHCLEIPGVQPSKPDHAKCGYSNDRRSKLHMEAMAGKGNQGVIRHSRQLSEAFLRALDIFLKVW